MRKNKLMAFAVVIALLVVAMCTTAFAAEVVDSGTCGENLTWTLDSDGVLTISGTGEMTSHPWTFGHKEDVTYAVIGKGVTIIGSAAFTHCSSLKGVTIPDGVTVIDDVAFTYCKSLESVTIPNSVTKLGDMAFIGCESLTNVTIPSGVKEISFGAFQECTSLSTITFAGDCPTLGNELFFMVTATAYYPINNPTWTEDKLQDYGGHITWNPYDPTADIIADTVTVYSGEDQSADVNVTYVGDGEISSVRLTIDSALPIASVTSDYSIEYNEDEKCVIVWEEDGESFGNGVLMTIHFDLNADPTPDADEYDINLVIEDVTDADGETIEATAQGGKVIIKNRAGDVNTDGLLDNRDVVMLARYLVRITEFTDEQIALADYNGDGQVSNSDLVKICRYIVGLE